jgi:hypothetical protein
MGTGWKLNYDLDRILSEIVEAKLQAKQADASVRAARSSMWDRNGRTSCYRSHWQPRKHDDTLSRT